MNVLPTCAKGSSFHARGEGRAERGGPRTCQMKSKGAVEAFTDGRKGAMW